MLRPGSIPLELGLMPRINYLHLGPCPAQSRPPRKENLWFPDRDHPTQREGSIKAKSAGLGEYKIFVRLILYFYVRYHRLLFPFVLYNLFRRATRLDHPAAVSGLYC